MEISTWFVTSNLAEIKINGIDITVRKLDDGKISLWLAPKTKVSIDKGTVDKEVIIVITPEG